MSKLRFAALGAAKILERYMGDALKASGETELVAIASRDQTRAHALGEKFGCRVETDYEALLRSSDIDAVYIPLPIGLHEKWAIAALEGGKHVLCEKSLSSTLSGCERMIAAAQRNGKLLAENFMCEFHPQHRVAMDAVREGRIGKVRFFEAHFGIPALPDGDIRYSKELGGGALNDVGAYLLFMSRKLFRTKPKILSSKLIFSDRGIDEQGIVHADLGDGVQASLHFGFGLEYRNEYQIWGEKGRISVRRAYSIPPDMKPPLSLTSGNLTVDLDCPSNNHFIGLLKDFVRRSQDPGTYASAFADLREQAELVDVVRSAR